MLLVDAEPSAPATSPMEFRPTERPRALQQTKMVQLDSLDRGNDLRNKLHLAAVSASSCSSSIEGMKIELHAAAEEKETLKASCQQMKQDMEDWTVTVRTEVKRLQEELEELLEMKLKLEQDLVKEKAGRADELQKSSCIMERLDLSTKKCIAMMEKTIQGLIGDLNTTKKASDCAKAEVEAKYQSLKSEFEALEQVTTDMRRCEITVLAEMDKLEVSCQQLECDVAASSAHARKETKRLQGLLDTMMWQKLQLESDLVREQDDNADIRKQQLDAAERLVSHISTSQLFWIKKTIEELMYNMNNDSKNGAKALAEVAAELYTVIEGDLESFESNVDSLDGETNDLRTKLHLTQAQLSLVEEDVKRILEREVRKEAELELAKAVTKDLEERLAAAASSCSSSIEGMKIELHSAAEENGTIMASCLQMNTDMDDLNLTLDDASKEIRRLQDELEHCSRRSSSYEIQAHALLKKKKLKLEQDLFKEKASRDDELKKKAYIMEIEETIKELEQLLDVVMYKVSSSKTEQLKRNSDIAQASNEVDLHAPLVCAIWEQEQAVSVAGESTQINEVV